MDTSKHHSMHQYIPPELDAWPPWWRAKIGIVVPSLDLTGITELQAIFPKGVLLLHTRAYLADNTPEGLVRFAEDVEYGIKLLATAKPDVISYHCTASAMTKGKEYEQNMIKKIEEMSGAKGASMAYSVTRALEALKAKKIVVVAPYLKEVIETEEKYLKAYGLDIVCCENLGMRNPLDYAARTPWDNYHFALNAYRKAPEAEAIFISCGAMRTIGIIEYLEKATGKPVISSNLCNAWMCLKLAGIKEPIYGFGSLLARER